MNIRKLPLTARLNRLARNEPAYPERTADELGEMTYQDVAARIDKLYCQETLDRAAQALDLLAAPLVNEDRLYGPMEEV